MASVAKRGHVVASPINTASRAYLNYTGRSGCARSVDVFVAEKRVIDD